MKEFLNSKKGWALVAVVATLAVEGRTGGNRGGQLSRLVAKIPTVGKVILGG